MPICRKCDTDKPAEAFERPRLVCRRCRVLARDPEKSRIRANRYRRGDLARWAAWAREYRQKRKQAGTPIVRNCVSDKYRKTGRFKFWLRAEVFRLKGGACHYCSAPADQIDHVVALANGGTDDVENLVPACKSCNSSKQDKPVELWLAERKVG
jgi:5-methylcytosine-specific restriction endonuclease McrA